jgi:hypothetical protein
MNSDNGQLKMKLQFPVVKALASAITAYHYNNSMVVRNTMVDNIGNEIQPNRQLITDYLEGKHSNLRVNDHYIKEAEGIITYLQQTVIMQSLKGTPDRFLAQITELITQQDIAVKDFGILAWAPKLADDYQKKDHVRELSARYEHRSNYVGRVGDKIELGFTLIEKRYIKSMDCYAVYGVNEQDNLIFYWARTLNKVCEVGRIHGRIKDHKEDEYKNKARITVLNYVKVL